MAKEVMEELKNLIDEERYEEAAALLPEVKERNAKTVSEMMALAKILGKTGNFEKSEKLYLKAYKKRPSRLVLKDIMQMFIESGMANEAENYYNQYIDLTPGDTITKLAAKYRIEKIRGTESGYLIKLLTELKEVDYSEEYGYELCKQYYKLNDEEGCRSECAELIEYFPNSKEAAKAKRLIAVMNGEISADEIKKKSGMPAWQTPVITSKEISTKELPTIEFSSEMEEGAETERKIAESVQDIISTESTVEAESTESIPDTSELGDMLKNQLEEDTHEGSEKNSEDSEEVSFENEEESSQENAPQEGASQENAPQEGASQEGAKTPEAEEPVPVRIYAETYSPECVFGKEDLADTKARRIITDRKIKIEVIFGQFFRNTNLRRQIYNSLELALIDKGNSIICVTGEEKTGRSYFAKRLIFCMYSMGMLPSKKVAVTDANVINRLSADEIAEKTGGCNIIVEKSSCLNSEGLAALKNLKASKDRRCAIILEDTDGAFATFIKNLLPVDTVLNNRIHFPKYTIEDLLGFAYDYIHEQGYEMEKVAANLMVSCINSTRAQSQGERYMYALRLARQSAETADRRVGPEILKMAAEAAFQEYYSLTIIREDITP